MSVTDWSYNFRAIGYAVSANPLDRQLDLLDVHVRSVQVHSAVREVHAIVPGDAVHVFLATSEGSFRRERGNWLHVCCGDIIIAPRTTQQWFMPCAHNSMEFAAYELTVNSAAHTFFESLEQPVHERVALTAPLRAWLACVNHELERDDVGSRALAGALMKSALVSIVRGHMQRCGVASIDISCVVDVRLRRAIARVQAEPSAPHTVSQLAAIAGMSRSAFARHFYNSVKQSPMEFVKQARLQHAASLLRTTDLSVKSVAARTGYASRSHFSRAFRAAFAVDPSGFRKKSDDENPGVITATRSA